MGRSDAFLKSRNDIADTLTLAYKLNPETRTQESSPAPYYTEYLVRMIHAIAYKDTIDRNEIYHGELLLQVVHVVLVDSP